MACHQTSVTSDNCPEDQSCFHLKLFQQYKYSDKSLLHLEIFKHTMIECRYNGECRSFQRLINGSYRLDDRGHCVIYSHPSRRDNSHVEKSVASKKFITGQLEISTLGKRYLLYDELPTVGDKESEKSLIEELENNGFGGVINIPSEKILAPLLQLLFQPYKLIKPIQSKTLWDIADEKMNHFRHVQMGSPLSRVEILAILLYTGTDAYSDLRITETIHYQQPQNITHKKSWTAIMNPLKERDQKWIFFSDILSNAIKKLKKHDTQKRPDVTYHGLHDVEIDPDSFFSYWESADRVFSPQNPKMSQIRIPDTFKYTSFVSTSTDRNIALTFMMNNNRIASGCLMEIEARESCNGADVSWISKFPRECEFLIDKGCEFYLKSLEFDESEKIQIAKIQ